MCVVGVNSGCFGGEVLVDERDHDGTVRLYSLLSIGAVDAFIFKLRHINQLL